MGIEKHSIRHYLGQTVTVTVDRPIGYNHKGILYAVNYGYLPGTLAADGEAQDAYILGVDQPLAQFTGCVIAIIHRTDDVEDKLVVAPVGVTFDEGQIKEATHFQERYFKSYIELI